MKSNFSIINNSQPDGFSEEAYIAIGSTLISDGFFLYMIPAWAVLNMILNIITFHALNKIKVKPGTRALYFYLKKYVFVCGLLSLGGTTMFITFSPRYISFGLDYSSRLFKCQIQTPVLILLHFYAYILDILIIIERLSQFSNESNRTFIKKYSPYKITLISMIFCIIVNMPSFFWYYVESNEIFLLKARETPDRLIYCSQSDFLSSTLGYILSFLMLGINDILTLIVEMILNIVLIFFYVKFLKKKSQVITQTGSTRAKRIKQNNYLSSDLNLFLMTIFLSLISFTSHVFTAFSTFFILGFKTDGVSLSTITLVNSFISSFKYFSNFFVLYIFNVKFRDEFKKFCSKSVN